MNSVGQGAGRLVFSLFFTVLILLFTGCAAPYRKPTAAESTAVRDGKKSLVLLRVAGIDNQTGPLLAQDFKTSLWRLDRADGRLEPSPDSHSVSWRGPSKAALDEGWRYALIEPGNYYVELSPKVSNLPAGHGPVNKCRFYLSIPAGRPVVYPATVVFDRQTMTEFVSSKTRDRTLDVNLQGLRDELETAKQVGIETLAAWGDVKPGWMISYSSLTEAIGTNAGRGIVVTNPGSLGKPELNGSSSFPAEIAGGIFFFPGVGLLYLAGWAGQGGSSGDAGAVILVMAGTGATLVVASVPIYGVAWGITRGINEWRWASYESAFQKQLAAFEFERQLTDSLAAQLAAATPSTNDHPPFVLQVQPYRAWLHGDHQQNFSTEIAVAVRLVDPETGMAIWQNRFVHTRIPAETIIFPENSLAPYETHTSSPPPNRLKQYRGDPGTKLLQREFQSALEGLTGNIVQQLEAAGFRGHRADSGQ